MIICRGVYTALALAATTNQRRPSLPMTYGNFEALALTSALGTDRCYVITAHWYVLTARLQVMYQG